MLLISQVSDLRKVVFIIVLRGSEDRALPELAPSWVDDDAKEEQGRMRWERSASACVRKNKRVRFQFNNIEDVKAVGSLLTQAEALRSQRLRPHRWTITVDIILLWFLINTAFRESET